MIVSSPFITLSIPSPGRAEQQRFGDSIAIHSRSKYKHSGRDTPPIYGQHAVTRVGSWCCLGQNVTATQLALAKSMLQTKSLLQ
jgi:hypothetical protein